MPDFQPTNRRQFLTGRSVVQAARDAADAFGRSEEKSWSHAHSSGYLLKFSRRAMACEFEFAFHYGRESDPSTPAVAALDLVAELEAQLTIYRDDSELARINRCAFAEPVAVEPRLFELLCVARTLWQATGGAYDITSGPLSRLWGFTRKAGRLPSDDELSATLRHVGMQFVELDESQRTIRFLRPELELNLGSIGKGYALDRCGELLRGEGIHDALLHGGNSSVLALGSNAAENSSSESEQAGGWWIGVRDPLRSEVRLGEVRAKDRAVGTSGAAVQFFIHAGKRYGHILDPRSGRSAERILSATVLAPTAAEADALSTAFYVMGVEASATYLEHRPEVAALLFTSGKAAGTWDLTMLNVDKRDWRKMS